MVKTTSSSKGSAHLHCYSNTPSIIIGKMGTKSVSSNVIEKVKQETNKKSNLEKWLIAAIATAGIGLMLSGLGSGVALAVFSYHGIVTIMGSTFLSLSLKPLAASITAFTLAYLGYWIHKSTKES